MKRRLAILFVESPALRIARIALGTMAAFALHQLNHALAVSGMVAPCTRGRSRRGMSRLRIMRSFHVRRMIEGNRALMSLAIEYEDVSRIAGDQQKRQNQGEQGGSHFYCPPVG
jgi:hypothetical protein